MASGRLTPLNGDIGTLQLVKLKALEVRVDWLSWVTTFLQHVSAPRLEGLTVHCYDASSGDIAALYSLIAEHHPRLRKINLEAFRESSCYAVDALRPLLHLPQLAVLSMKGWGPYDVDDAFIAEVANAWPALELLELDPLRKARRFRLPRRTPPPRATLTGLVPLAQHCPRLESIKLALNTDIDLPDPAPWRSRPVRESQVQMLHVGMTGPTRNPAQVVRFLSEHFPLLGSVGFYPRVAGYRRTVDEWRMRLTICCTTFHSSADRSGRGRLRSPDAEGPVARRTRAPDCVAFGPMFLVWWHLLKFPTTASCWLSLQALCASLMILWGYRATLWLLLPLLALAFLHQGLKATPQLWTFA